MKGLFLALVFGLASMAASVSAQIVAFTNVSVIPMDRERVLANQTVVIRAIYLLARCSSHDALVFCRRSSQQCLLNTSVH